RDRPLCPERARAARTPGVRRGARRAARAGRRGGRRHASAARAGGAGSAARPARGDGPPLRRRPPARGGGRARRNDHGGVEGPRPPRAPGAPASPHGMTLPPAHETVVARLVADVRPVRRLWPPAVRLVAWAAAAATVLVFAARVGLRD